MWTETTRKAYERKNGRYATDLTDEECAVLEPLPHAQSEGGGRPWMGRLWMSASAPLLRSCLYIWAFRSLLGF